MTKHLVRFLLLFALASPSFATTYYLDTAVGSSGNGLGWATAWKNFSNVTGLAPGDTVLISGGTYTVGASPIAGPNGTSLNPITYQAAPDIGHNGIVTLTCSDQCIAANASVGNWTTWDGNVGGASHFVFNSSGSAAVFAEASVGSILRYTNVNGGGLAYWDASGVEVDHVVFTPTAATVNSLGAGDGDAVLCPNGGAASYTTNKIHDSTFYLWYTTPGIGIDGLKWCAHISVYNNRFIGVHNTAYTGGQHQDGTQSFDDYEAYYNNYYENIQNYAIYQDPHSGAPTSNHWRIYNNVFNQWSAGGAAYAVASGCENVSCTISDLLVANNTVVNAGSCMGFSNVTLPANYSTTEIVNNICYNSGPIVIDTHSGTITNSNNTNGSTTGLTFVNAQTNASGDWHLISSATAAIGQAINPSYLTSVYTTDKDGTTRTAPWDIGAYSFGGATGPLNPPSSLKAIFQ